jgi:hypothetical protein
MSRETSLCLAELPIAVMMLDETKNASFKKRVGSGVMQPKSIPLFGWSHSSAPAYANDGLPRAGAVKKGRSCSGRPQGLFLTAASMAAF